MLLMKAQSIVALGVFVQCCSLLHQTDRGSHWHDHKMAVAFVVRKTNHLL